MNRSQPAACSIRDSDGATVADGATKATRGGSPKQSGNRVCASLQSRAVALDGGGAALSRLVTTTLCLQLARSVGSLMNQPATAFIPCPESPNLARFLLRQLPSADLDALTYGPLDCDACCRQSVAVASLRQPHRPAGRGQRQRRTVAGTEATAQRAGRGLCGGGGRRCDLQLRLPAPPQGPDELGRLGGYRVLKVLGPGRHGRRLPGRGPAAEARRSPSR